MGNIDIKEGAILQLEDDPLGLGAEKIVFQLKDRKSRVAQIARLFGKVWQTQGIDFIERCISSLEKQKIKTPDIVIHRNPRVISSNPLYKNVRVATETEYIANLEELRVKWKDMTDPEKGPVIIRALIMYMEGGYKAQEEDQLGVDPYGGEIFMDLLKGAFQTFIKSISEDMPSMLRGAIQSNIRGVEGQARNILWRENEEGEYELDQIDIGMHDFSDTGKFKVITKMMNDWMLCSFREIIIAANKKLPENVRIPEEEVEAIPVHAHPIYIKISHAFMEYMIPLFDAYEKGSAFQPKHTLRERFAQRVRNLIPDFTS